MTDTEVSHIPPNSIQEWKWKCSVIQSCLTLCDPMYCSPPGFSVHSPGKNTGVGMFCIILRWWFYIIMSEWVKVAQSCPTVCNPINTVHEILQARILEWVAFPFSREYIIIHLSKSVECTTLRNEPPYRGLQRSPKEGNSLGDITLGTHSSILFFFPFHLLLLVGD